MCKWYEGADEPHANRWIVLIAFLMGLSIGIHLLNLLTIPAFVFMYYYRKNEDQQLPFKKLLGIFLIGVVIEALLVFLFIPYLPKLAAFFDRIFVNGFGLPYNSGALFFMVALLALCFWSLFATLKKGKVFWNTVMLCVTTLVIGFSLFSIVIIRSSVKTPTNEYQPDNAYTLVRYLSREQYGSTPLLYGQYFDAPYDLKTGKYWAPLNGKYVHAEAPADADYLPEGKMLFPRMWSNGSPTHVDFYESYMDGKGIRVKGATHKKPTFGANLRFFFDYQLNWMYWRYFMWNFVGRQNEIHSPTPGELFYGNWESGIGPIDRFRLGDQRDAPAPLAENKGKNHYFFLPLLLGLLGLVFQFDRDKRGSWIVFLMFFMTGIAIVLYLNQPPYQVRERDYAYAGSFYMFAIWIGLGVAALYEWINDASKGKASKAVAVGVSVLCLGVPALMAEENWDDHDRSHRYTSTEMAANYLNSVGPNGMLVTHGDNDTFPLWYAQEIEGVRTDVRVVNTSLLGTDWYIDQMKWASNESKPLPLTVPQSQYLYGTNEYVFITYDDGSPMMIKDVMDVFKDPKMKAELTSRRKVDFICARKIVIPVNKENCLKYGIVPASLADQIPETITLTMSEDKNYITKPELFMRPVQEQDHLDRSRPRRCPGPVPQDDGRHLQVGCPRPEGLVRGLPEHVHLPGRAVPAPAVRERRELSHRCWRAREGPGYPGPVPEELPEGELPPGDHPAGLYQQRLHGCPDGGELLFPGHAGQGPRTGPGTGRGPAGHLPFLPGVHRLRVLRLRELPPLHPLSRRSLQEVRRQETLGEPARFP